ncbi:MAG: hypothetical protein ACLR9X_05410 [Clostridia bacterium]
MNNGIYTSCKKCQSKISKKIAEKYDGYCKNCYKEVEKIYKDESFPKRLVIFLVFFLILFILILKNPIMKQIAKNDLSKQIENEILKDLEYTSYKIDGKYTNQLIVQMKDDFESMDYSKKEQILRDISNKFEDKYKLKEDELINIDKKNKIYNINYIEDKVNGITKPNVILVSKDNKYTIEGELKKNDKEYSKEDYLIEKIIEQLSNVNIENKEELSNLLNSVNYGEETLNNILNISDVKEKTNEIIYQTAQIYVTEDYKEGVKLFQKIIDYKDSRNLIEKINKSHELDGEWVGKGTNDFFSNTWVINGNKCYNVFRNMGGYKYNYNIYNCVFDNNILYIFETDTSSSDLNNAKYKMKYESGKLVYEYISNIATFITTFSKASDNTKLKPIEKMKKPSIGMTKKEVEESTWGKPEDINKTTTRYGTREQWCYSGYRYIYFEDGIVTSIQD